MIDESCKQYSIYSYWFLTKILFLNDKKYQKKIITERKIFKKIS